MNNTIFVLIMIFGGSTTQSGMSALSQEFNSSEACMAAEQTLRRAAVQQSDNVRLRISGCFKK